MMDLMYSAPLCTHSLLPSYRPKINVFDSYPASSPAESKTLHNSIEYLNMIFNTQLLALATVASTLVGALPLNNLAPRAKSYSVVNVGGGASTEAPAEATTVVDQTTRTVEVTNAGPTVTAKVTTTVLEPVSVPAETSASTSRSSPSPTPSSSSSPSSSSTSIKATTTLPSTTVTPTPVFVTITVTDDAGPTEYYDNGMWHTSYRIKTFEAVAAPTLLSTLSDMASSTSLPAW
ncbi:hypothetical protein E8E11_005117 [Didymella keratinophila]|nr:hypothetical protein E8E11_005117 [Didymella keratinophila]